VAATDLPTNGPNVGANRFMAWATSTAARLIGHSASDGALPQLMAATMPGVKGGQYFGPQGWLEYKGRPGLGKIEPHALDREVAAKLWAASEKLTGVSFPSGQDSLIRPKDDMWRQNIHATKITPYG